MAGIGYDGDTYVMGIDQDGNAIEGDAMAYLAVVLPPTEELDWTDCTGACLDTAPELPAPTDDDFAAAHAGIWDEAT